MYLPLSTLLEKKKVDERKWKNHKYSLGPCYEKKIKEDILDSVGKDVIGCKYVEKIMHKTERMLQTIWTEMQYPALHFFIV